MVKKILMILSAALLAVLLGAAVSGGLFPGKMRLAHQSIQGNTIPVTGSNTFIGCPGSQIDVMRPDYEQQVVELTNQVRAENGLPPLKRVSYLDEAARYHAADMSFDNYFDHNTFDRGSNGGLVASCDTWQRMENYYKYWNAMGENIAAGQRSPEIAMDGWMNSPEHYRNMMSDTYWEMGSGYFEGNGSFRYYWGQNFGRRNGVYPVIINLDAAKTTSNKVNVYVYGSWREMRMRINEGSWSRWMDFKQDFSLTLPDEPGEYTVSVEMRSRMDSSMSSDTIELVRKNLNFIGRLFAALFPSN